MDPWSTLTGLPAAVFGPNLWWMITFVLAMTALRFPMLRRGPNSSQRDPWRGFKFAPRATVLQRAGGRCEGAVALVWGRCSDPATEVDHIVPWSRGGPTVISNGQALCRQHNRRKGNMTPPWWYVLGLEWRRRSYFPAEQDVRVLAVMDADERAARERSSPNPDGARSLGAWTRRRSPRWSCRASWDWIARGSRSAASCATRRTTAVRSRATRSEPSGT